MIMENRLHIRSKTKNNAKNRNKHLNSRSKTDLVKVMRQNCTNFMVIFQSLGLNEKIGLTYFSYKKKDHE